MKPTAESAPDCPLTPALIELLQSTITLSTTNTNALSDLLCKSPATINTQFKNICALMNVHTRFGAVMAALKKGWIVLEDVDEHK